MYKAILIGGSAGSFQVINQVIHALPATFSMPVIIVLHRLRNVASEMSTILTSYTDKIIVEPDDKDAIEDHYIYLAPQNYHLLIEQDGTFSLDYSEPVQFCRPSIDVTFQSASKVFGAHVLAILLSGANKDGSEGLKHITANGGKAIVQHPLSATYPFMPTSAIETNPGISVLYPEEIIQYLNSAIS